MMLIPESGTRKIDPEELSIFMNTTQPSWSLGTDRPPWSSATDALLADLDRKWPQTFPLRDHQRRSDCPWDPKSASRPFCRKKSSTRAVSMPGKLLLVDMEQGRIIPDDEIKRAIYTRKPYRLWVNWNRITSTISRQGRCRGGHGCRPTFMKMHLLYGYSREDVEDIITRWWKPLQEPTGSMGLIRRPPCFPITPAPLQLFQTCFAQVTNPPSTRYAKSWS